MSLANSNGPQWIRAQHAETKKRWEGIAPIREFLAGLLRGKLLESDPSSTDVAPSGVKSKPEPF
jgi:hypothetical protein